MTITRNTAPDGTERVVWASCPFCSTPLDTPANEGGAGVNSPGHWEHRCPMRGEVRP